MKITSPFPSMDPYLEGSLWPDVHHGLASAFQELLAPKIAPKYVARIEKYTVEDTSPASEVGIQYPDVTVFKTDRVEEPATATYRKATEATPPDLMVPTSIPVRIPFLEIRDTEKNRLITAIEILSPVNKRKPGYELYQKKRNKLHQNGVHLLEIDLLRRGKRVVLDYALPKSHYMFSLWRAGSERIAVWANSIEQPLPVLPVPLKSPDPDVLLPLKTALDMIYQRGLYHLSIDYDKDPVLPQFSEEDREWMQRLMKV